MQKRRRYFVQKFCHPRRDARVLLFTLTRAERAQGHPREVLVTRSLGLLELQNFTRLYVSRCTCTAVPYAITSVTPCITSVAS